MRRSAWEPEEPDFNWILETALLRLKGPTFSAYFTRKKDRFKQLATTHKRDGVTAKVLLGRAEGLGIREITQADYATEAGPSTDDITQDALTEEVSGSFGYEARIIKAKATVPGGTHVSVDFEASTVVAVTNSTPDLAGMARTAVKALVELDQPSLAALDDYLSLPPGIPTEVLVDVVELDMPQDTYGSESETTDTED